MKVATRLPHYFELLSLCILDSIAFLVPDRLFLRLKFFLKMHKKLHLQDPQTYNEKLQWLKLYYRRPDLVNMVDKVAAKTYVSNLIGEDYIIPTIGIYNSVDEITWESLPDRFVIKCAHDSGGIVICKDIKSFDIDAAKRKLKRSLKVNYYYQYREWPYRDVPRRLICEEYKTDESGIELKDYKFFCFDGVPKAMFVASDRMTAGEETKFDFYDMEFNHLPFCNGHPNSSKKIAKPAGFEEMKRIASRLSAGLPHVRVDLYDINGKIFFGEMTFFHWSGMMPFRPEDWDYTFGGWLNLPEIIR